MAGKNNVFSDILVCCFNFIVCCEKTAKIDLIVLTLKSPCALHNPS